MIGALKRFLVGRPIETAAQHDQRLSKRIALAVFSSDALSSVAYASEAILVVLITAGTGSLPLVIEISLGIALLLLIVGFSYRQTIYAVLKSLRYSAWRLRFMCVFTYSTVLPGPMFGRWDDPTCRTNCYDRRRAEGDCA
jgi:hypothetical protein